ncbi:MAG: hypothetical protein WCT31_03720 [Candidatus Micrarchaeia archaeon]
MTEDRLDEFESFIKSEFSSELEVEKTNDGELKIRRKRWKNDEIK